jgi:hypothetical protein
MRNVKFQSSNVKMNLKPKCQRTLIFNFGMHLEFGISRIYGVLYALCSMLLGFKFPDKLI